MSHSVPQTSSTTNKEKSYLWFFRQLIDNGLFVEFVLPERVEKYLFDTRTWLIP